MTLPWCPRFVYGATTVNLSLPMLPPTPADFSDGGMEFSAAGVPSGYTVRNHSELEIVLRVTEAEYPTIRTMIRALQNGLSFTFRPDQGVAGEQYTCYLVAPVAGDRIEARRSDEPSVYEVPMTLRTATGAFDVRYFADA